MVIEKMVHMADEKEITLMHKKVGSDNMRQTGNIVNMTIELTGKSLTTRDRQQRHYPILSSRNNIKR